MRPTLSEARWDSGPSPGFWVMFRAPVPVLWVTLPGGADSLLRPVPAPRGRAHPPSPTTPDSLRLRLVAGMPGAWKNHFRCLRTRTWAGLREEDGREHADLPHSV